MITFFLKYSKEIILTIILAGCMYTIWYKAYNYGYDKATVKYEKEIAEYNKKVLESVVEIQVTSNKIQQDYEDLKQRNARSFKEILAASKVKPLTIVDNSGMCNLTPNFIETFNKAMEQANK